MKNSKETTPRYVRVTGTITAHTSAMHGELHQQLYSLVAAQDKQKLHLTDELLKAWNDLIAQEVELNNAQQDTELTAKMQQLDDDRDALITQIFSAVRSNRRSPVKALREPAERLVKLVNSYKGIQTGGVAGREPACERAVDGFGQVFHRNGGLGADGGHRHAENHQRGV